MAEKAAEKTEGGGRKMSRLSPQGWIEQGALAKLEAGADPLAAICGRARAERGGEEYLAPVPLLSLLPPSTPAPVAVAPKEGERPLLELLFAANAERSGAAVKILLVVMQHGDATISTSAFLRATGLKSNNTVLSAIRECVDWGWLTRAQICPRCAAPVPDTEERIVGCVACGRQVSPEARYTLHDPTDRMQKMQTGMQILNTGVQNMQTAEQKVHTEGLHLSHTGLENSHTGVQNMQTSPVQNLHTGMHKSHTDGMQKLQTPMDRINRIIGHTVAQAENQGMQKVQRGMQNMQTPRARADSDSESNITNDSVYMNGNERNGNETKPENSPSVRGATGRSETELLAQASCKALEEGTSSLGMHIKAWAHARQLDAKTGGSRHQMALSAIQRELAQQHSTSGQAQGKAWTRRVYDYFEAQGKPLPKATGKRS